MSQQEITFNIVADQIIAELPTFQNSTFSYGDMQENSSQNLNGEVFTVPNTNTAPITMQASATGTGCTINSVKFNSNNADTDTFAPGDQARVVVNVTIDNVPDHDPNDPNSGAATVPASVSYTLTKV